MENKKGNGEIEKAIRECNSKYCVLILQVVFEQPGIRLINLANTLHVPASNLQRVLKRMMNVNPKLIYSGILEGKTKGFWVSKEVEEYFGKTADSDAESDSKTNKNGNEIFGEWIQLEGTLNWRMRFQEVIKNDQDILAEEKIVFEKMIKKLSEIKDKNAVKTFLGEELFSLLMKYITEHNGAVADCVCALADLYTRSWESALRLIDYVFDVSIYHNKREEYRPYGTYEVEQTQFDAILWALGKLVAFVRRESEEADKDMIFQLISEETGLNNSVGFYIAEKILSGWGKIDGKTDEEKEPLL